MIILPIWLWLVLFAIAVIITIVRWAKKMLVDKPKSARAVAVGTAIPDSQLESHCRHAIVDHELTAPGQTQFVAFLQPLEYSGAGGHARTPISLGLTERTLGVSYRAGSLGNMVNVLIKRKDIRTGCIDPEPGGFSYLMETVKIPRVTFRLQSQSDLDQLAAWVQASQREAGDSAQ
jgi:hypothetical protein